MKRSFQTTFRKLEDQGFCFDCEDVEDQGMSRDDIVEIVEGSDVINCGDDLTGTIPTEPISGKEFEELEKKVSL